MHFSDYYLAPTGSISTLFCRYILLKERNMLLTMEQAYKDAVLQMPNEERIDKVSIMSTHNHHCNKNKAVPSFVSSILTSIHALSLLGSGRQVSLSWAANKFIGLIRICNPIKNSQILSFSYEF